MGTEDKENKDMAIRKIPKETKYYSFYNANPFERRTADCPIRALSLVLEKDWKDIYKELLELTLKTGWAINSGENKSTAFLRAMILR